MHILSSCALYDIYTMYVFVNTAENGPFEVAAARHRPIRHRQERTKFTMSVISKPTEECTREGL